MLVKNLSRISRFDLDKARVASVFIVPRRKINAPHLVVNHVHDGHRGMGLIPVVLTLRRIDQSLFAPRGHNSKSLLSTSPLLAGLPLYTPQGWVSRVIAAAIATNVPSAM